MARQSMDDKIAAAVAAAFANLTGLVAAPAAPAAAPAPAAPATPAVAAAIDAAIDAVAASQITATLAYVAESRKGAQIEGDKSWYNVVKGAGPLFTGFSKGDRVLLSLNDAGRVLSCEEVGTESAKPTLTVVKPAAPTLTVVPPTTPAPTPDPDACLFCGGKHFKYKAEEVARSCAERQYKNETGDTVALADPMSLVRFGTWASGRTLVVHAYNNAGCTIIGESSPEPTPEPEPTPPAPSTPTPPKGRGGRKNAAAPAPQATAPAAPRKGGRASATDQEILAAAERLVAAPPAAAPAAAPAAYKGLYVAPKPAASDEPTLSLAQQRVGTWTGLLAKHATSTANTAAGLFKFVCPSLPGNGVAGNWIKPFDPKLVSVVNAANENDRVTVTLNIAGEVIDFKVVGDVTKETGHRAGVKTSGKQQPAEPKRQPADPKVAKARQARADARKAAKAEAPAEIAPVAEPTDDVDANLAASAARKRAARAEQPAEPKLTAEQLDKIEQAAARKRGATTITVNRRTKQLEVRNACSGNATHRTTCNGRC